jgi:myosin heavy subunit
MKLCFLSLVLCLLISCTGNSLPDGVLERDRMIEVLIDLHLAEAAITNQALFGEEALQRASDYYDMIYKKHGITKEEFKASFEYYSRHPQLYKEMYDQLIAEMTRREPELKKSMNESFIQPPAPVTVDTTRKRDTIPIMQRIRGGDSVRVHRPGAGN